MILWEVSVLQMKGSDSLDSLAAYKHKALIRVLLHYKPIAV